MSLSVVYTAKYMLLPLFLSSCKFNDESSGFIRSYKNLDFFFFFTVIFVYTVWKYFFKIVWSYFWVVLLNSILLIDLMLMSYEEHILPTDNLLLCSLVVLSLRAVTSMGSQDHFWGNPKYKGGINSMQV